MDTNFGNDEIRMPNDQLSPTEKSETRLWSTSICPFGLRHSIVIRHYSHCPSGVVTSVPASGLNSNVDGGIGVRVWFEYVVTMRSPFGSSMSVRSTRNSLLIRRSSF